MNMLSPHPKTPGGLTDPDRVRRISGLLDYIWSPLGLPAGHVMEHEYDKCLTALLDLLDAGAGPARLAEQLQSATLDLMGSINPMQVEQNQELARLMHAIYHGTGRQA